MNEPVIPGTSPETDWLLGELGGKYFVQRLTLDPAGRSQKEIAKTWVDLLTSAIRRHDQRHMITVGVIPWAHVFPKAQPLFYSEEVSANLDFVSVHFYPKNGEVEKALTALKVYHIGKPLVIEEMFPLHLAGGTGNLYRFLQINCGWVYRVLLGKTIEAYEQDSTDIAAAITRDWLTFFQTKGKEIFNDKSE